MPDEAAQPSDDMYPTDKLGLTGFVERSIVLPLVVDLLTKSHMARIKPHRTAASLRKNGALHRVNQRRPGNQTPG